MRAPQIGFGFLGRGAIGWFRRVRNYVRGNKGCAKIGLLTPDGSLLLSMSAGSLGWNAANVDFSIDSVHLAQMKTITAGGSLKAQECE